MVDSVSTFNSDKNGTESSGSALDLKVSVDSPHYQSKAVDGKQRPGLCQRFDLHWLTAYRVLITGVVLINISTVVWQLSFIPDVEVPLTATAANIMAAVLLRQEEVINISFKLVSKLPVALPLTLRKVVGDFHHYGGVHIGCALSALLWYCVFVGLNTIRVLDLLETKTLGNMLYVDIATAYTALLAIMLICLTAIPQLRVRFHNTFEATHRFGSWMALLVLWVHAGIATLTSDAQTPLYTHPSIWMLAIITALVILPWLRIRRISITASQISAREVQLSFPHKSMPYTSTMRFSTAVLTEWHAFATIPVDDTSAKIIISQAGDWTASIIASPPAQLWVRYPPTLNFLTLAPLFNSLLLVATGAGIGPMLSLLASPTVSTMLAQGHILRVMWCVYDPYATHWAFVLEAIQRVDNQAKIFDSKTGRPDVAFEARYLAEAEGLEAVMVVSNPKVTKEVVNGCKSVGLAAYGAVLDS
jgi:hypothetical protein